MIDSRPPLSQSSRRGVTLLELAIVIVILGLLLGGGWKVLSAMLETRASTTTDRTLKRVESALLLYAARHAHLPCPAAFGGNGEADCGVRLVDGSALVGAVPWRTLGLPGSKRRDGRGNTITYAVSASLTADPDADGDTTRLVRDGASPGVPGKTLDHVVTNTGLTVRNRAGGDAVSDAVAFVLVAHGRNGHGAWHDGGFNAPPPDFAANRPGEARNRPRDDRAAWVERPPADTFDDSVRWLSAEAVASRADLVRLTLCRRQSAADRCQALGCRWTGVRCLKP